MCLAVPGKIVRIVGEDSTLRTGKVDFGGIFKEINLSFVPEAKVNDYVLVHVGFALNIVDEKEASRVFEFLKSMDALQELEQEVPKSPQTQ
jgi:hydrogenase expression/formation protein HypC